MRQANFSSQAMGEALVAHRSAIWRFALSLSRSRDVADDLLQATMLRAMEKHQQFDGTGRLDAWCLTICRSIWLNQMRAEKVRATQAIDSLPEGELRALLPAAETNILAREVFTEVMKLSEAQRETVLLVYCEGFRYSEAAQILDVPIGTVMSRLASARARLRYLVDEDAMPTKAKG